MTKWSSNTCDTNGIKLHYTRTGGNHPAVILLHGLIGNGACWTALAHSIENEYDVIMPDARGHGKSSIPIDGYRYEDHAKDIVGLIEALNLSTPILIGHSMGGMTAALVASSYPKLLSGLILLDPTFLSLKIQHEVYDSNIVEQHQQILSTSLDEEVAKAQIRSPHRSLESIKLIAQARFQTSVNAFNVLMPPNPDYMQFVSNIKTPSLIIIGDTGNVVSITLAEEIHLLNSRIRTEQIQKAGHGVHYDQPKSVAVVVKSFLHSIDTVIEQ